MASSSSAPLSEPPPANMLRIMMATDNHLGYLSNDPIRGNDSFNTMDEILQLARDNHCDMVVLGGDLFHDNKPSRRTFNHAQKVFKKHVFGDGAVSIKVVSDQQLNFGGRCVNYEDPNLSVQLPVFIIHGNHDDPTLEGVESLSALDVLADAGLVNYFGRQETAKPIKIHPVLIEKGPVKLSLYGLGWIRDERLNYMFTKNQVSFLRPSEDQQEWFNLFLIHQNREDKGRGPKNAVAEKMIPSFMHLVMWGHEHGCEIEPIQRPASWYFSQPGSSVACSLAEHEAVPKHVGILEICLNEEHVPAFRLHPVPLKSVRPFIMVADLELDAQEDQLPPNMPESEKSERVFRFLTKRATQLLDDYESQAPNEQKKVLPLLRLKVEHTGFPAINIERFGAQFVQKVANPSDVLLFWKRKVSTKARNGRAGTSKSSASGAAEEGEDDEESSRILNISAQGMIARLVEEQFLNDSKMELLNSKFFTEALEEYVGKDENAAVSEFVEKSLEAVRQLLRREKDVRDEASVKEAVMRAAQHQRQALEMAAVEPAKASKIEPFQSQAKYVKFGKASKGDEGLEEQNDSDLDNLFGSTQAVAAAAAAAPGPAASSKRGGAPAPAGGQKKAGSTRKRKAKSSEEEMDEEEEEEVQVEEESAPLPAKKRRKAPSDDDEDDDSLAKPSKKKSAPGKKPTVIEMLSDDDAPVKQTKPGAATIKAKAKTARAAAASPKAFAAASRKRATVVDDEVGEDDVVEVVPTPSAASFIMPTNAGVKAVSGAAPRALPKPKAHADDEESLAASVAAPLSQAPLARPTLPAGPIKLDLKVGKQAKNR